MHHIFLTKILYNQSNSSLLYDIIPERVAYDTDTELLQKHLIELALNHPLIHKENKPIVLFEDFGDNALKFTIVFSMSNSFNLYKVKSDLRFSMN